MNDHEILNLTEELNRVDNLNNLFYTCHKKLSKYGFEDSSIVCLREDNCQLISWKELNISPVISMAPPHFSDSGISKFDNAPFKAFRTYDDTRVLSEIELRDILTENSLNPMLNKVSSKEEKLLSITPLFKGEKKIGIWMYWTNIQKAFNEKDKLIIKNIQNLLSNVVANLLAQEQIEQKNNERIQIEKLIQGVSSIASLKDTYSFIFNYLQPIFDFDDISTIVIVNQQRAYRSLPHSIGKYGTADKDEKPLKWQTIQGTHFCDIPEARSSYIIPLDEPGTEKTDSLSGSKAMMVPLVYRNKTIGALKLIYSKNIVISQSKLDLMNLISRQLTVVLKNLLTYKEVLSVQYEKEILISICEKITKSTNKHEILKAVNKKLCPLFAIDAAGIIVKDKANKTFDTLFLNRCEKSEYKDDSLFSEESYKDEPIFNTAMRLNNPYKFEIDRLLKKYPGNSWLLNLKNDGFRQGIMMRLKTANSTFGLFAFLYKTDHDFGDIRYDIFKSTVNRVALSLKNILSYEYLNQHQLQKEIELSISFALEDKNSWSKKFLILTRIFKELIPFDYVSFAFNFTGSEPVGYGYHLIADNEYRIIDVDSFLKITGMSLDKFKECYDGRKYTESLIYNDKSFIALKESDHIKKHLSESFNVQSNLNVPVRLSLDGMFQASFYSKDSNTYNQSHLNTIKKFTPGIKLIIENTLSFEQITSIHKTSVIPPPERTQESTLKYNFGEIIGESAKMEKVYQEISIVAPTDYNILILGETGTGKELVAHAIHTNSGRAKLPFIRVNCAALPAELMESELFGHEKGAFTGATSKKIGKFELANKGTLFLDEIGELPILLQVKLLRAIQEKEIEPIGGHETKKLDLRIVAATNRNLDDEIKGGNFRSDLFYRLNGFPINLPPLRERKEDIPLLANHFIQRSAKKLNKDITSLSDKSLEALVNYDFPGNIREMERMIEYAALMATSPILDLTQKFQDSEVQVEKKEISVPIKPLREIEREVILKTLKFTEGKVWGQKGAAEILGLHPNTLYGRMKKLGIQKEFTGN